MAIDFTASNGECFKAARLSGTFLKRVQLIKRRRLAVGWVFDVNSSSVGRRGGENRAESWWNILNWSLVFFNVFPPC